MKTFQIYHIASDFSPQVISTETAPNGYEALDQFLKRCPNFVHRARFLFATESFICTHVPLKMRG